MGRRSTPSSAAASELTSATGSRSCSSSSSTRPRYYISAVGKAGVRRPVYNTACGLGLLFARAGVMRFRPFPWPQARLRELHKAIQRSKLSKGRAIPEDVPLPAGRDTDGATAPGSRYVYARTRLAQSAARLAVCPHTLLGRRWRKLCCNAPMGMQG
jgi:hypothetical protein